MALWAGGLSIAVVQFDLKAGQTVKSILPADSLSDGERAQVAFHAFPDSTTVVSNRDSVRDTLFHFRIRRESAEAASPGPSDDLEDWKIHNGYKRKRRAQYLWCYSFCRQRQDRSLPRGGSQTSVVVLAERPFMALLHQISKITGSLYFDHGQQERTMEDVVSSIENWNSLRPKATLKINAARQCLPVHVPERRDVGFDEAIFAGDADPSFLDSHTRMIFSKTCLFSALNGVLRHLWHLYEIVLLGKPMVIFGGSPEVVSDTVAAVMDLINPLPYHADYRPYFTVQDTEFAAASKCDKPGSPKIVGVTNSYFLKAYSRWPNILVVGGSDAIGSGGGSGRAPSARSWSRWFASFAKKDDAGLVGMVDSQTRDLWTKSKPRLKPSYALLETLEHVPGDANESERSLLHSKNSRTLRRHFHALTRSFLQPFEDLFFRPQERENAQSQSGYAACLLDPPSLPPFDRAKFFAHIGAMASYPEPLAEVSDRHRLHSLYQDFVSSPNFESWMTHKQALAKFSLKTAWIEERLELAMDFAALKETEVRKCHRESKARLS